MTVPDNQGPGAATHPAVSTERSGKVWIRRESAHVGPGERRPAGVTLFDPLTGDKMRLGEARWTSVPELIDVKLTERCGYGCAYCYVGSTPDGQDATRRNIEWIAREFGAAGCLEAAIGGGEPTLHPDLIWTLETFRRHGVVPNFTTRNPGFVRRNWSALGAMGGFAVSVTHLKELTALLETLRGVNWRPGQVNVQLIMGIVKRREFKAILDECARSGVRATLLGYKFTGRGSEVRPGDHSWWIEDMLSSRCAVSIDTALAAAWSEQLLTAGISPHLFHTLEGVWSAYIDAVAMTIGPSSYGTHHEALTPEWPAAFAEISQRERHPGTGRSRVALC